MVFYAWHPQWHYGTGSTAMAGDKGYQRRMVVDACTGFMLEDTMQLYDGGGYNGTRARLVVAVREAGWLTQRSKGSAGARGDPSACDDRSGGGPPRLASFSPHFTETYDMCGTRRDLTTKLYDCFILLVAAVAGFIRSLPLCSVWLWDPVLTVAAAFCPKSAHVGPPQL